MRNNFNTPPYFRLRFLSLDLSRSDLQWPVMTSVVNVVSYYNTVIGNVYPGCSMAKSGLVKDQSVIEVGCSGKALIPGLSYEGLYWTK